MSRAQSYYLSRTLFYLVLAIILLAVKAVELALGRH